MNIVFNNNKSDLYKTVKNTLDKYAYIKESLVDNGRYKNKPYKKLCSDYVYLEYYLRKNNITLDPEIYLYLYTVSLVLKLRMKGYTEFNDLSIF